MTEKMRSDIYELAASRSSLYLVAARFKGLVQVWDLNSRELAVEHKVAFMSGAGNLAMSPDGSLLVTGVSAARSGCVAAYEVLSGRMLWKRKGLVYPSRICFGPDSASFWVTVNEWTQVERLDATSGATTERIKGVSRCLDGPAGERFVEPPDGKGDYRLSCRGVVRTIDRTEGTVILRAAFGLDCLFLSEGRGPLRCIDVNTARERWRHTPPEGSHFVGLHFSDVDGFLYAILLEYERGSFRNLLRFDVANAKQTLLRDLIGSWDEAFVPQFHQVVTSDGSIVDLDSGAVVAKLPFPQVRDRSEEMAEVMHRDFAEYLRRLNEKILDG